MAERRSRPGCRLRWPTPSRATSGTCAPSAACREHSVRAYRGDVLTLLEHARRMGRTGPGDARPAGAAQLAGRPGELAGWPAPRWPGGPRPPVASPPGRRATAWSPTDAGALLATPRTGRSLPGVLRRDEAERPAARRRRWLPTTTARPASATWRCSRCSTPAASGSASCAGWTSTTSTAARRVLRVLGKGAKERTVPVGAAGPARRGRAGWPTGRPRLRGPGQRRRAVPGRPGRPDRPADRAPGGARAAGARPGGTRPGAARPPPFGCHPPTGRWSRPEKRSRASRPRYARHDADLYPCVRRPAEGNV